VASRHWHARMKQATPGMSSYCMNSSMVHMCEEQAEIVSIAQLEHCPHAGPPRCRIGHPPQQGRVQATQEEPKEHGAQQAALLHATARKQTVPAAPARVHGILCISKTSLCTAASTRPRTPRRRSALRPQQRAGDAVVFAFQVQTAAEERLRLHAAAPTVDQVLQGEHLVHSGPMWKEARLHGYAELHRLPLVAQAVVEQPRVQAEQWAPTAMGR